jgi:hypothetical protein
MGTVLVENAPAGNVAEFFRFPLNQALPIDGADTAHDLAIDPYQKAIVGFFHPPILPEGLGPVLCRTLLTQVFGKKAAKVQEVFICDWLN